MSPQSEGLRLREQVVALPRLFRNVSQPSLTALSERYLQKELRCEQKTLSGVILYQWLNKQDQLPLRSKVPKPKNIGTTLPAQTQSKGCLHEKHTKPTAVITKTMTRTTTTTTTTRTTTNTNTNDDRELSAQL
eukprot:1077088-Amphidinium_carterae.1